MTQLDLFDNPTAEEIMEPNLVGAPPIGAVIVPFPQSRNVGRVRHVATKILERDGRPRDAYWRRIIENMAAQLERAGLDECAVQIQVDGFTRAVQAEIDIRIHYRGRGDGAA